MSDTVERTYAVEGMTCGHCELSVREEVEGLAGVQSAQADWTAGHLTVRGDVEDAAVRAAVRAAGYEVAAVIAVASARREFTGERS